MAESAVGFLLNKLDFLLEKEVAHLGGVRDEVVGVKAELEQMKAFLRDADALESEDEGIRTWVKLVRELAHDTEDIVDEFLIKFEHRRWVGFYGRLLKVARAVKKMKDRHKIAAELQKIRSRAADISVGRRRYRNEQSLAQRSSSYGTKSLDERRNDARLVPKARLVGIERPKCDLVNWLFEGSAECRVLAMHGMGGLGKTTLVNQVYEDSRVKQCYKYCAWITVSQSFVVQDLLLKVMEQMFVEIPDELHSKDTHSLKKYVKLFLEDKNYLIVLDDVWTTHSWESLKLAFPDNNCGSRMIVTTRDAGVANVIAKDLFRGIVYPLYPLSRDESWNLFCSRAFQGRPCPSNLEAISLRILEKCKGLPLGIVAISGLLATKDASLEEWERVRCSLGADFHDKDHLGDMKKILSLSFDDLPYDLKSCFLYLSMFPEDWVIHKRYVIHLWVAEGFIQQVEDTTPEEVGNIYFNELQNRSMIQVVKVDIYDKDNVGFQVHDLMLEIILQKSKNQNFCASTSALTGIVPEGVRRLSVVETHKNLKADLKLSKLRTMILLHSRGSESSPTSELEFLPNWGVRFLKVLDYSSLSMESFPKFVTRQYNLRYLNLSGSNVASTPRSIGRLRNLATLNLNDTLIQDLPVEIFGIHGLRHLMVSRCFTDGSPPRMYCIGVRLPPGIEALSSMQTLFIVQVSRDGLSSIRSIGKLKHLRFLHIQHLKKEHGPALCSMIEQLSQLREVFMESREEDEILDVQNVTLQTPPFLNRLVMFGRLSKLPSWVSKLESLAKLALKWSNLKVDPLESLQALPNLLQLYFEDKSYDGEELCFKAGGFKMLKRLWIQNACKLRQITVEEGSLPCLQELWLESCELLEEVPAGIEFLTGIKKLYLINMNDRLVTRLHSRSEDSGFQRIKHVPTLFLGSWNAEGRFEDYPYEFQEEGFSETDPRLS